MITNIDLGDWHRTGDGKLYHATLAVDARKGDALVRLICKAMNSRKGQTQLQKGLIRIITTPK